MYVLLTVVSVLCGWTLLTVLVLALLMVLKPLQGATGHMEKIAMGVRAIERQTQPLGASLTTAGRALNETAAQLGAAAAGLAAVDEKFAAAGGRLRSWFGME